MAPSRIRVNTDDLLSQAQTGNDAALDALLQRSRKFLSLLARNQIGQRLQGKADASDLVQEALLEVHRHFPQFRGTTEAEYAAWLRSILAGLVANHVRRFLGTKQRDARLEQALSTEMNNSSCVIVRELDAAISSPSEQVARQEDSQRLRRALDSLPEHYRQVITLRHIDGLPFATVAEQMGRTVDSVEKLWVRALARLREALGDSP
jgi:RNA polymerase sigma-70 factor (ECF subfamily)